MEGEQTDHDWRGSGSVEFYERNGYHPPIRALCDQEAGRYLQAFLDYRGLHQEKLRDMLPREQREFMAETHFFLRWVYDMVTHPRILDAVSAVLGPDVLLWSSQWFPKFPGDRAFVTWHQDAAYWGLDPPLVTTAWIALTPATRENGCLRVVPGSHLEQLEQHETYGEDNLLSRGQEIAVGVDESDVVDLELAAGEFSLHHVGIVHGSEPNSSDTARIGLAVRYIAPQVVQKSGLKDVVLLVRGEDRHGNFELGDRPLVDGTIEDCMVRNEAMRRKVANLS